MIELAYPNADPIGIDELLERLSRLAREDYLAGPSNRHYATARQFLDDAGAWSRAAHPVAPAPRRTRTAKQQNQSRARRNNRRVTWQDETLTVTEWSARTGITTSTLFTRLHKNWPLERVFEVRR